MLVDERTGTVGTIEVLEAFGRLGLLAPDEIDEVLALLDPSSPLAEVVAASSSIHLHVKVPDVAALPEAEILAMGVVPTSRTEGYVKFPFSGGVNVIFSSIPVAEDDMLGQSGVTGPVLDHKGIDLRTETAEVRALFDAVPALAAARGWRHAGQGGAGQPVYCCHTEVSEKHWVFPDLDDAGQQTPIEVAYGSLTVHDAKMGCDLRPIDPAHPRAGEAKAALSACAGSHPVAADAGPGGHSYYEPADLGRFAEVGRFASEHMDRFWAYYNGVFAADGALTVREKALIGLAVAHAHQCPYCIDAFTGSCLDAGADADQVHEAVHAAASLAAGIHLVHGVQLQNALRSRGAID